MNQEASTGQVDYEVGIVWPDGIVQVGSSWEELEESVRTGQYDVPDRETFREHMATRAKRWSGVEIITTGSSKDFFYELERAVMLRMLGNLSGKVDPTPRPAHVVDLDLYRRGGRRPQTEEQE